MLFLFLTLTLALGLETCRDIVLSGIGDADGKYSAPTDYRGRPDFFREDRICNLFREENVGTCYWRIDSALSEFPFWRTYDCSYHPVDIESPWFVNVLGLNPENVTFTVLCEDPVPSEVWKVYLLFSFVALVVVVIVVYGHVLCRRKRIAKSKRECVVCRRITKEGAKVVSRAFNRKPSLNPEFKPRILNLST